MAGPLPRPDLRRRNRDHGASHYRVENGARRARRSPDRPALTGAAVSRITRELDRGRGWWSKAPTDRAQGPGRTAQYPVWSSTNDGAYVLGIALAGNVRSVCDRPTAAATDHQPRRRSLACGSWSDPQQALDGSIATPRRANSLNASHAHRSPRACSDAASRWPAVVDPKSRAIWSDPIISARIGCNMCPSGGNSVSDLRSALPVRVEAPPHALFCWRSLERGAAVGKLRTSCWSTTVSDRRQRSVLDGAARCAARDNVVGQIAASWRAGATDQRAAVCGRKGCLDGGRLGTTSDS